MTKPFAHCSIPDLSLEIFFAARASACSALDTAAAAPIPSPENRRGAAGTARRRRRRARCPRRRTRRGKSRARNLGGSSGRKVLSLQLVLRCEVVCTAFMPRARGGIQEGRGCGGSSKGLHVSRPATQTHEETKILFGNGIEHRAGIPLENLRGALDLETGCSLVWGVVALRVVWPKCYISPVRRRAFVCSSSRVQPPLPPLPPPPPPIVFCAIR